MDENLGVNISKPEESQKSPVASLNETKPPVINFDVNKEKSIKDQAKAIVDYAATQKAVEDEKLVKDITDFKKEELKTGAESSLKEEQAKSKEVEKSLQEANYGVYEGVAELIGLKKSLPNPMLKALMYLVIPFLVVYYMVVGLVTGIINITMDCVNSIVKRFSDFSKSAKNVIIFVLIAGLVIAILLVIYWILKKYGIINF